MNVLVVGLGVMGGSLALALKSVAKYTVYGVDISKETLEKAEIMGMIEDGFEDAKEILPKCDIVIIGLYPKLVADFVKKYGGYFKNGAICMDVTGIKSGIIADVHAVLPKTVDFVFAHPMAGREDKGVDFASSEVLRGANFLITPTPENKPESINTIKQLAEDCGFGRISELTADEHDEIIAFTSQLSHVIAMSLINSDTEKLDTKSYIGDSYRGITRIASINAELWTELFYGNKKNLLEVIDNFQTEVSKMRLMIETEDHKNLMDYMSKASSRRKKIN